MKILCVFPHPDDETIFAGGIISRHVLKGDEVVWICASYGEKGGSSNQHSYKLFYFMFSFVGKFPVMLLLQKIAVYWLGIFRKQNMELAKIRKEEAKKVANILGVKRIIFLNIPDMCFNWNREMIKQKIKTHLEELQPDIVYTLYPNGITGHPDHEALSKYITLFLNNSKEKNLRPHLRYITFSKEVVKKYNLPLLGIPEKNISEKILLSPQEFEIKLKAIKIYESQNYLWQIFLEKYPELLMEEYCIRYE